MSRSLNILLLASWYPSREHPTLGNFVQRHAEAIALQHRVCVLTAVESGRDDMEVIEKGKLFEIKVYFKKQLPLLSYYKAMGRALAASKNFFPPPDLVHVHVAYPAGIMALRLNMPYVITEHFSGYHPQANFKWGFLPKLLTRRILNRAEKILPVSDHLGKAITKFGSDTPREQVSNVVDTSIFYPASQLPEKFTFLHISTLEERSKNISGILKSFKKLEDSGEDFLLKIGGDGDLEELRKKISQYGPSFDKVVVVAEKPIAGIAGLMREAHCLVMFSHFENQPCTILEALCSGLPVITSDVGGIPEVINSENGILVGAGNQQAFVAGLQQVMSDYQSFDRQKIAAEAKKHFSYSAIAHQLSRIYTSVLN